MDTRKIALEYRLAHWSQVVQERKVSGLTIKKFCEDAGLHPNVYYYWQRKLREVVYGQIRQEEDLAPTRFTEVKLIEPHRAGSKGEASQLYIEVNGIQFSADETYIVKSLVSLLRELVRTW